MVHISHRWISRFISAGSPSAHPWPAFGQQWTTLTCGTLDWPAEIVRRGTAIVLPWLDTPTQRQTCIEHHTRLRAASAFGARHGSGAGRGQRCDAVCGMMDARTVFRPAAIGSTARRSPAAALRQLDARQPGECSSTAAQSKSCGIAHQPIPERTKRRSASQTAERGRHRVRCVLGHKGQVPDHQRPLATGHIGPIGPMITGHGTALDRSQEQRIT